MTNMIGSKLSIFSHSGKITGYWILVWCFFLFCRQCCRTFPCFSWSLVDVLTRVVMIGNYKKKKIWASILKWSCSNPITGYFPGVWKWSPLFVTLQCEETKGIIHSRIIPAIKALPKEPWRHAIGIVYYSSIAQEIW
jgi:hypothetical protein